MISDLLMALVHLDRETDDELEEDLAVEAVIDGVDREVSPDEREEFEQLVENGWLDRKADEVEA